LSVSPLLLIDTIAQSLHQPFDLRASFPSF
jgi:hypothetical protein